jgi:sulfur carrier protein
MSARIRVNGKEETLHAASVAEFLHSLGIGGARGLAVALNGAVVPLRDWPNTRLRGGDDIEIVRPFGGG